MAYTFSKIETVGQSTCVDVIFPNSWPMKAVKMACSLWWCKIRGLTNMPFLGLQKNVDSGGTRVSPDASDMSDHIQQLKCSIFITPPPPRHPLNIVPKVLLTLSFHQMLGTTQGICTYKVEQLRSEIGMCNNMKLHKEKVLNTWSKFGAKTHARPC